MTQEQVVTRSTKRRAEGRVTVSRPADRREKRYAFLLAQGFPQWKAYQAVSGAKNKDTCERQGQRWFARQAVQSELARIRTQLTEEGALSRAEKRHHLARIARSEDAAHRDQLMAVAIDNKMTGDDEPFRKAGGDDLRVELYVLRIGEEPGATQPALPSDPVREAIDVTVSAGQLPDALPSDPMSSPSQAAKAP